MIKLLLILSLFISVFGTDTHFILPNNHSAMLHHLGTYFKKAHTIVIVSPAFNHSELKKKIEKSAQKGTNIILVINKMQGDPLSMIQYQNIELLVSPIKLHHSVIVVDERIVCSFHGTINQEDMSSSKQSVRCSDDKETNAKQHTLVQTLLHNGKPYLE